MKITALIPAAGSGSRFDIQKNKLLTDLNGTPVIVKTLLQIVQNPLIDKILICTSVDIENEISILIKKYSIPKIQAVIIGGDTRQESVYKGLKYLSLDPPDYILIHDGARPLLTQDIINNSIERTFEYGASIAAVPVKDTIKIVKSGKVENTPAREELFAVQTPQTFKFRNLLNAHDIFKNNNFTDDAALVEKMGLPVVVSQGSYKNIKITTQEDLSIAECFDRELFNPLQTTMHHEQESLCILQ